MEKDMRKISIVIIALLFPFLIGTTYIVRENGKEVGRFSENDGSDVTRYIDNNVKREASSEITKNVASAIERQEPSEAGPFSLNEEYALRSFFHLNFKPLHVSKRVDFGMKKDILSVTTLGDKFNGKFCKVSRMIGSGLQLSQCLSKDLEFEYTEWRQDNPLEESDCYDVGTRFGDLSYDLLEDEIVSLLLSEEDYEEWKDDKEKAKLEAKIDSLESQVAGLANRAQY